MKPGDRVSIARCADCEWTFVHPDVDDYSAARIQLHEHHKAHHCRVGSVQVQRWWWRL